MMATASAGCALLHLLTCFGMPMIRSLTIDTEFDTASRTCVANSCALATNARRAAFEGASATGSIVKIAWFSTLGRDSIAHDWWRRRREKLRRGKSLEARKPSWEFYRSSEHHMPGVHRERYLHQLRAI
jgi:hypothetical protein